VTHDELLAEIKSLNDSCSVSSRLGNALKAVVELHKPDSTGGCNACEQWTNEGAYQLPYPCPTIQAIYNRIREVM